MVNFYLDNYSYNPRDPIRNDTMSIVNQQSKLGTKVTRQFQFLLC